MATLNVCCHITSEIARFQVTLQDLNSPVKALASEINNNLKSKDSECGGCQKKPESFSKTLLKAIKRLNRGCQKKPESFSKTTFESIKRLNHILYCGQVLDPETSLSSYSIQHHSTVYVVRKFTHKKVSIAGDLMLFRRGTHDRRLKILKRLLCHCLVPLFLQPPQVERMLSDPDTVENIIAATPGLDKDPSVLAMLQEPELLAVLAHPNNMESLLQLHPSFGQAAITIATVVNEEGAKSGMKSGAGLSYSMDQMSDEEEDLAQPQVNRMRGHRSRGSAGGQSITASQLAAALQAATGSAAPENLPSSSAAGPSGSGTTITSDFFQQAMEHAQSASSDAALQQLRDMGITDENVARQALVATGGDIQAAIDLIFGDGFM